MLSRNCRLLFVVGLTLCGAGSLFGGNFEAPAEGPIAFRRDQVPLDPDTMSVLSRNLTILSQGLDVESDKNRRTIAQILAIATALDPGNGKARELISDFKKGNPPSNVDADTIDKCLHKIWKPIAWLEQPEAGSQGRALSACLLDVVMVADLKNPRTEALRAEGEHGAWTGWVPQLEAYRAQEVVKINPEESPNKETPPAPDKITLARAHVNTILWKNIGNDDSPKWAQTSAPLQMNTESTSSEEGASRPFALEIGPSWDNNSVQALAPMLVHLLENQHVRLPAGRRVMIAGDALEKSMQSGKRQSISGAVAVLTSAAISGRAPDATIIGTVNESGNFKLPSEFWNQLLALGPGKGGRLVLPAAAADYLPSMLAMGKPQFFFDYEVLLASNYQELLEMSAKNPSDSLEKASAQFREIREKMGSQTVGPYVANSFIRRRLSDLSQAAPYHFSAKMLVIQGAGNRPAFIPRTIIATETRRALEPLDWVLKMEWPNFGKSDLERLMSSDEACHVQLEGLVRYAERKDLELINHAQELLAKVKLLERAIRPRGEYPASYDAMREALRALIDANSRLMNEITEAEK